MNFDDIAAFALGPARVPEAARAHTATLLIDTLGVTAGATTLDVGRIARDHAHRFHGPGRAEEATTLLFDGRKASLPGAAFASATQTDNLDAHDGFNPTKGHIGCAVVPALCALAEHLPDLAARDALDTLAIAYELSARAAIALHATVSDYHTSGAWNALGTAALACRLRGATKDQFRQALGIAEYHGPRSQMMREIANPTMLHDGSGMGAFTGLMAALLAEDGFQGAPAITVEAPEAAPYWDDLGTRWTVAENYIKPYPICRWAHAALDALGMLIDQHGLTAGNIARIKVNTFAEAAQLFPAMPATTSQAQYSLAFALGARLVHGKIGPDQVTGNALKDPAIAAIVAITEVAEDPRHSARFPAGRWSDVTLTLKDGRTLTSGDIHARGGPEARMTDGEVEAKFHTLAACLGLARTTNLWAMRNRLLDPDARFSELLPLLHGPL